MSLLSPEHLVVSLAPEQLSAIRLAGYGRPRLLEQQATPLQSRSTPLWAAGIEALEILLDKPLWSTRDLTIILSSHFVHYVVLPGGKHLAEAEQADLARLIFRKVFGELAHDWALRASPSGKAPSLASGIPQALLSGLNTACEGRTYIKSIQPGLMTVFNKVRSTLKKQSGILALVETGRITLASINAGEWQSITSRAWEGSALSELLEEVQSLSGQMAGGQLWLCDLTAQAVPPATPDWRLQRLLTGSAGAVSLAVWGTS